MMSVHMRKQRPVLKSACSLQPAPEQSRIRGASVLQTARASVLRRIFAKLVPASRFLGVPAAVFRESEDCGVQIKVGGNSEDLTHT